MGDPSTHVVLGEDDVLGTNGLKDSPVRLGDGLGPNVAYPQGVKFGDREDVRLDVTNSHDDMVEVDSSQLLENLGPGRVGDDDTGKVWAVLAGHLFGGVNTEHLVTKGGQFHGECATKPAQSEDEDFLIMNRRLSSSLNQ